MKALSITMAVFAALLFAGIVISYAGADVENKPGAGFIDEDGDGICDNAGKARNGGDPDGEVAGVRDRKRDGSGDQCEGDGECDGTGKRVRSGDGDNAAKDGNVTGIRKRTRTPDNCGGKTRRNIRGRSK